MPTLRKIKIVILDDNRTSMQAVLCCALPQEGAQLYPEEILEALNSIFGIKWCKTVTEAILICKEQRPDIIFSDLLIKTSDETDPDIAKEQYQGLYFLKWLKVNYRHDALIKIHSQYTDVYEVERELENAGLGIRDAFKLDFEFVNLQRIKNNFPDFLKEVARNHWKTLAINAETRRDLRERLDNNIKKGNLDTPIPQLGGFSVKTLLAGWLCIREADETALLGWQENVNMALSELTGNKNTASKKNGYSVKERLDALRNNCTNYAELLETAQAQALEIIQEFVNKWQYYTPSSKVDDSDAFTLASPHLSKSRSNINAITKKINDETQERHIYLKTVRFRLVLGGIYELRSRFTISFQQKIVDYTILGCIRNSISEVSGYCANHLSQESQVKKYLSVLGLGKEQTGKDQHQALKMDLFYEEERLWIQGLDTKI
jgi:hypothetical protein